MIKQAKRRGTTEKLSFCVADATALSYENENFDCVVISNALHIMPEPEKAMQEIRRVLKKMVFCTHQPSYGQRKIKWFTKAIDVYYRI